MHNSNYVCIGCRINARRAASSDELPLCPHCGCQMTAIGDKLRVPAISDDAGWKELVAKVLVPWRNDPARSRRTALELQLRSLNALGITVERLKEIREIEEELSRYPKES